MRPLASFTSTHDVPLNASTSGAPARAGGVALAASGVTGGEDAAVAGGGAVPEAAFTAAVAVGSGAGAVTGLGSIDVAVPGVDEDGTAAVSPPGVATDAVVAAGERERSVCNTRNCVCESS